MSKTELPAYSWFSQVMYGKYLGNVFTGSLGTSPEKGCLWCSTLKYKVYLDFSDEENICIAAEYCRVPPITENGVEEDYIRKTFPASQEGLDDAARWLNSVAEE